MASYGHAAPPTAPRPANYGAAYAGPAPVAAGGAPAGTFSPGTKIQVGNHRVVIQKYLSEGGFAHVYLVKLPSPVNGTNEAVLKRVAVPDKESLRGMRTEVETMKRLKGHRAIVTYIDSHASELRGGGYEVFLLMEFCNGGGLIDFMNTRLQHRLTEPEILHIFADVAEGVACMHYLRPSLLHRDLKVENVLITVTGSTRKFKLCDFGSAAAPRPAPTTPAECRATDEDVQKHTTMQYRSPEMVDVYRKLPIDEKSDIWALGVLLYKLCYYTTPFEEQGQLAILNASYRFPSHPVFSDRLKGLIAWMLRESPQARPNIYQVLREACAMQNREPPVKDIYSSKAPADAHRRDQPLPDPHAAKSPPTVGAVFSPQITQQQQVIPEVERMRRGRVPSQQQQPHKPSPSPGAVTDGDPFAALDARAGIKGGDELSSKFPTLDQFSLLHDKGQKFEFDDFAPNSPQLPKPVSQGAAQRVADEAFQTKPSPASAPTVTAPRQPTGLGAQQPVMSPPLKSATAPPPRQPEVSRASTIISNTPELKALASPTPQERPKPVMVSIGTMTSPSLDQGTPYQIHRFPPNDRNRAASVPRPPATGPNPPHLGETGATRTPSYQGVPPQQAPHVRYPSSSRPSLEGGRPNLDQLDPTGQRSRLAARPRPVSTHMESNLDFLREQESRSKSPALPSPRRSLEKSQPPSPDEDSGNIESNVDFLRSMEDSDPRKKEKHHTKRGSLSSLGAGTKNILAGKFGDAFKRFEGNAAPPAPARTPSPLKELDRHDRHNLTPIAGSEALDGRSDDGQSPTWDEMTPEMRREEEARMLAQEEARVAAAQAEYRQRVGQRTGGGSSGGGAGGGGPPVPPPKSIGGVSRVASIQNKVQSLIDESNRSSTTVPRTAQGYGHYSDAAAVSSNPSPTSAKPGNDGGKPVVPRKTVGGQLTGSQQQQQQQQQQQRGPPAPTGAGSPVVDPSMTGRTSTPAFTGGNRPAAPPKPTHLNKPLTTGGAGGARPPSPIKHQPSFTNPIPRTSSSSSSGIAAGKIRGGGQGSAAAAAAAGATAGSESTEALLAVDLPGGGGSALLNMTAAEKDDYINDFQKRFPSLGAIEMVERDLAAEEGRR
ncbi:hypothetical protein B0J18DRAFT_190647 [Chaetomium sp. MPI-SDFR-AT-0129]|nr:hypothetical protein B0J18DRAFT_190647 [Chaetomium sp. MPI-SDFR-AT-0129]